MENYSLSDIAAVSGRNDGMFGGNGMWIFALLILMLLGGGGFGFNGNRPDAVQQEILSNQHFNALDARITALGNGIADSTFALNNSILTEGRAMQTQLANCCCDTKVMIADLGAKVHAEGEATRSMIQQNKIDALTAQVNELKTQNMFCGIPRINPYGYGVYPYAPSCGCGGGAYGNI